MWGGDWDVHVFESLDSTNTYLLAQARAGAPEAMVVVADHQVAGRGRLDRRWESPPGASLLTSILFRPAFDPVELHLCSAAVALAAVQACGQVAGVDPVIKWPNDLMVGGAKLAGVLAEVDFSGATAAVVVGIGINVSWPGPPSVQGTCLDQFAPAPVDRQALLAALLDALAPRRVLLDTVDGRRGLGEELRRTCATLGQHVRVDLAAETISGLARAIDDSGHLIVETDQGPRRVAAGDVVHVRAT